MARSAWQIIPYAQKEVVRRARRKFWLTFVVGMTCGTAFCLILVGVAAYGRSMFQIREFSIFYGGPGAGSSELLLLLITGLMAFVLISQSFRNWRYYRALRDEERSQGAKLDDGGA